MPTININSIEPNAKVYVTGIVDFSRIATQIDGDELAADNAKKVARGMQPVEKAHTRITISRCQINYENPAAPTLAEQYIAEKFYASKNHPELGRSYLSVINKSKNLPNLYCRDNADSKQLEAVKADGELMPGIPVTIMIRFFKAKNNNGCSLDTVIVNEKPIRYFGSNSTESILAERGFEIVNKADVNDVRANLAKNLETPVPAPAPAPVPASAAYTQPAPEATAIPAPAPTPAPSLPIPPKGYVYDENGRIVPESTVTGGIKL